MLADIHLFIPSIKIIDIKYEDKIIFKNEKEKLCLNRKSESKIIIFENVLKESRILLIIQYLSKEIKTQNIIITCISCNEKTLNIIGDNYPELQIYTTQIII